jgi:hypothetical protein
MAMSLTPVNVSAQAESKTSFKIKDLSFKQEPEVRVFLCP